MITESYITSAFYYENCLTKIKEKAMVKFKRGVRSLEQVIKNIRQAKACDVSGKNLPKIYAPLKNRVTTERGKHFVKSILYFTIINGEVHKSTKCSILKKTHKEADLCHLI